MESRRLKQKSNSKGYSEMGTYISELLHLATKTHMTHLKTTSFASHMALGEFYEALPDLADNIAEQYQGVTGTLLDYPEVSVNAISTPTEAITHLTQLYNLTSAIQNTCPYSEIINELDMVKSAINKTKYKLIFLK